MIHGWSRHVLVGRFKFVLGMERQGTSGLNEVQTLEGLKGGRGGLLLRVLPYDTGTGEPKKGWLDIFVLNRKIR